MRAKLRGAVASRVLVFALVHASIVACSTGTGATSDSPARRRPNMMDFSLTSPAFDEGAEIPASHTCDGGDAPIPLRWSGAPDGTTELALLMEDPDARGFVHWIVVGIPAESSEIGEAGLPDGAVEGRTGFGRSG